MGARAARCQPRLLEAATGVELRAELADALERRPELLRRGLLVGELREPQMEPRELLLLLGLAVWLRVRHHRERPEAHGDLALCSCRYSGCGTTRMYGFGAFHSPKSSRASSSETDPAMITSSPRCHWAGVATLCLAVSCSESITRSTSSKFR